MTLLEETRTEMDTILHNYSRETVLFVHLRAW